MRQLAQRDAIPLCVLAPLRYLIKEHTYGNRNQTAQARNRRRPAIPRPAHDGVATQRDLRETERYLADRFDTRLDKSEERMNAKFDRMNAKLDRITWIIIGGLGIVVASLIAILVQV